MSEVNMTLMQQIVQAWERTARGLAQDVTTMRAEVELTRIQLERVKAELAEKTAALTDLATEIVEP